MHELRTVTHSWPQLSSSRASDLNIAIRGLHHPSPSPADYHLVWIRGLVNGWGYLRYGIVSGRRHCVCLDRRCMFLSIVPPLLDYILQPLGRPPWPFATRAIPEISSRIVRRTSCNTIQMDLDSTILGEIHLLSCDPGRTCLHHSKWSMPWPGQLPLSTTLILWETNHDPFCLRKAVRV